MNQEAWQHAESLFHAALERNPEDRRAFLENACAGDTELRRLVERLLAQDERAGSFLEHPLLAVPARGSLAGRELGPYRIDSLLGAGGMGEVYRAHDGKLDRDVAIKTLPPGFAQDPERLARFRREARILASLNHPNIAAIHGLEESEDVVYLVLELVEGDPLAGPLPPAIALDRAVQVAAALEAAHEHGIIHRDLKPANIKVTPQGTVKVLDFGVAKAMRDAPDANAPGTQPGDATGAGQIVGTPGYMSPEQAQGTPVDQRTDIWAFGCLLYELLTGARAFHALDQDPDWRALPAETPAPIRQLIRRCLEKDVNLRLASISEARTAIERARRRPGPILRFARRPAVALALCVILLLGGLLFQRNARIRWVRQQATPEIARLFEAGELRAAFKLIRKAKAILPNDPTLNRIHYNNTFPTPFRTNPPGAEIWVTAYDPNDNDWMRLGTTPFDTKELPWGVYRFRIMKPGYRTILASGEVRGGTSMTFDLDPVQSIPTEMVRVPAGASRILGMRPAQTGAFLIDRYEVTNRQFQEFIDRGGYRNRAFWKHDFVQDARKLTWEEAIAQFRDASGCTGPATWENGRFAPGRDDDPVAGVSWYEAAAFAESAGKQLPTIHHWERAASPGFFADIMAQSNFGSPGPARVGTYRGLGAFGTLDMAGNVKEWCWNESGGLRFIRGGAWNEPSYMFVALDARTPWDRNPRNGIRCVRRDADAALDAPVTRPVRDFNREKPVADGVFQIFRSLYAYDPADLDARVEGIDQENDLWKREKVSFAAAYGNERIQGYLYIPKHARPPYQAVIYVHPGMAFRLETPQPSEERFFRFLIQSGRAFLLPVLKGHYQRRYNTPAAGPNDSRDRLILESKDFRRSIDYLVSRADVDRERIGAYGVSRGYLLAILAVGDLRLRAAVLASSGFPLTPGQLPEADAFHFMPRFRVPTLMIGGNADFQLPPETSQRPMFRLLGAPDKDKRLLQWDGGHACVDCTVISRNALQWFDRYLGPVNAVQ